jgi:hypothetical protein
MVQGCIVKVLEEQEKHAQKQNWRVRETRGVRMDKDEAERLARAIRMVHVDWIKVRGVEYNPATDKYEVRCEYKQEHKRLFQSRDAWTTLLIKNPRQWIDLLTQHGGGLELP